jgi:ribose 5-phosphate isomerase B
MLTESEINVLVDAIVKRTLGTSSERDSVLPDASTSPKPVKESLGTVALGSDHGGFMMKQMLASHLAQAGYRLLDCGTGSSEAVDYPDFALVVADKVSTGEAWRGIMIDGAGIGSCMVANKVRGVRAAMCYDLSTAANSRAHNDANVLTLGAGLIGEALARQIAETWLSTEFAGGRHSRRVDKIRALDDKRDGIGSEHAKQS